MLSHKYKKIGLAIILLSAISFIVIKVMGEKIKTDLSIMVKATEKAINYDIREDAIATSVEANSDTIININNNWLQPSLTISIKGKVENYTKKNENTGNEENRTKVERWIVTKKDITGLIVEALIILGGLIFILSKEKIEDERIDRIRLLAFRHTFITGIGIIGLGYIILNFFELHLSFDLFIILLILIYITNFNLYLKRDMSC